MRSIFRVGDEVWFTPPPEVNTLDHGLLPGEPVSGLISDVVVDNQWYVVEYDEAVDVNGAVSFQRDISAHINELQAKYRVRIFKDGNCGDFPWVVRECDGSSWTFKTFDEAVDFADRAKNVQQILHPEYW